MGLLEDFVDGTIDLVHDGYDFVVKAGQETVENFVETTTAGLVDIGDDSGSAFLDFAPTKKDVTVSPSSPSGNEVITEVGKPGVPTVDGDGDPSGDGIAQKAFYVGSQLWVSLPVGIPEEVELPSGKIREYKVVKHKDPPKRKKKKSSPVSTSNTKLKALERELKELRELLKIALSSR